MQIVNIILEFTKIALSWPAVVLALGVTFIRVFKGPISEFFRRIVRGEAYGFRLEAATPLQQSEEAKETVSPEQYIKENPTAVIKEFESLYEKYRFERAYNLIYGTQMALLEYLETKANHEEKCPNLFQFYSSFLSLSNLYTTKLLDYLAFLHQMGFIEYKGESHDLSISITVQGLNFLKYVREQYHSSYKYRPY